MKQFWEDHSLPIMALTFFVVMCLASWAAGFPDWQGEEAAHGLGTPGYGVEYAKHWVGEVLFSTMAEPFGFAVGVLLGIKWRDRVSDPQA